MSKHRIGPKVRPTSKRTIQNFEKAVRRHEIAGSFPPAERELVEEQYFNARFDMYDLVQQLEARSTQDESIIKGLQDQYSKDHGASCA